jgi:hypothetical protein
MTYDKDKAGVIDPQQVLRNSYRESEQAIDVITNGTALVPAKFTRIEVTRDTKGKITKVEYYDDDIYEVTKVITTSDSSGSLNSTYFNLYAGNDYIKYYVWYDVSGTGVDPSVSGAVGIEVDISTDDDASVVALATKLAIDAVSEFNVTVAGNAVNITTAVGGLTTNSTDSSTGFSFETVTNGGSTLVGTLIIEYNSDGCYIRTKKR